MSGNNVTSADNQQETLYYFSGFLTGEGSISLIKASNTKGRTGFYYTPDITISNADRDLLKTANQIMAKGRGIITPIKGGYNLSIRGKEKVKIVLAFLERYPPICGDLIHEKLDLLIRAVEILSLKEGKNKRQVGEEEKVESIRVRLREIKKTAQAKSYIHTREMNRDEIGFFLSGLVDAEGSMGMRRCGARFQPFFSVAMREKAVIDLFREYIGFGNIYYRPVSKLYHFETGKREYVKRLCSYFLQTYPVRLKKNQDRLLQLQRILND